MPLLNSFLVLTSITLEFSTDFIKSDGLTHLRELGFENDKILAFKDITPQAPVHILIIPKKRIKTVNDISSSNINLIGELIYTAKKISKDMGFSSNGYRLTINCGDDGCQTVDHLHLHLLAGRKFIWPPG